MRMEWSPEELVESWTLVEEDWRLLGNKGGATRLGFAVVLKFFEVKAAFPVRSADVPSAAVAYPAEQVRVDPSALDGYRWTGRTIEYHRAQVREAFGFREFAHADEDLLSQWLSEHVCPVEQRDEQLLEALLVRCRALRIGVPRVSRTVDIIFPLR